MKIGMLLEAPFPPDLRVENEMRTLAAAGHEIVLYCLKHKRTGGDEKYEPNIRLKRWYLARSFFKKYRTTIVRLPFYARGWKNFIAGHPQVDAIHVHDLPLARVGQYFQRKWKIPFILDLHENYPAAIRDWRHDKRSVGRFLYARKAWEKYEIDSVQAADQVIVVVDEAKARLVQAGIAPEKITVVSNTFNFSNENHLLETSTPDSTEDELRLNYVGGFGELRGLQVAIQAMPQILEHNPQAKLFLVGDGANKESLQKLAAEQGLTGQVIFTGWLPLKEAFHYIVNSEICLVPYLATDHTETTIPHKIFQYMYLKKPVLVSSCKPLKRIIEETDAGRVFQAGDSQDFARAVTELLDEQFRKELGENGNRAVIEKYNWQVESVNLIKLYSG